MAEIDLDGLEITDEMLREIHVTWESKLLRLKHPYAFDLIKVMAPYPMPLRRTVVLTLLRSNRARLGLPVPPKFDDTAQGALEFHCRESDNFKRRNVPDTEAIFCWPKGKGAGVWGLLRENAREWVKHNRSTLPARALK